MTRAVCAREQVWTEKSRQRRADREQDKGESGQRVDAKRAERDENKMRMSTGRNYVGFYTLDLFGALKRSTSRWTRENAVDR
jgi:hypothetical protein